MGGMECAPSGGRWREENLKEYTAGTKLPHRLSATRSHSGGLPGGGAAAETCGTGGSAVEDVEKSLVEVLYLVKGQRAALG